MQPIHNRMPMIFPKKAYAAWLDSANQDIAALATLLQLYPAKEMEVKSTPFAVEGRCFTTATPPTRTTRPLGYAFTSVVLRIPARWSAER